MNYRAIFLLFIVLTVVFCCANLAESSPEFRTPPIVWDVETVSVPSSTSLRPQSELVLDTEGNPHIVFHRNTVPNHSEGSIYHAVGYENMWEIEKIADCSQCDVRPAAAFDSVGNLHVVYHESGTLRYGQLSNNIWQVEQIPTPGLSVGHVALTVDGEGLPHIVFNNNTTRGSAHYATIGAGTWEVETIEQSFSPFSIALDNQGTPIVAGYRGGYLRIATLGSTGWETETVGPGGYQASIAIDNDGVPHIGHAVINDDDLRYATRVDNEWQNDVVHHLGPGAAGPSLALGPSGLPQMTFEVHLGAPGGPDDQVMHSYFDGDQWNTGIVSSELSTESGTSLAISTDGRSHLVYSNQNQDIRYGTAVVVPEPCALLQVVVCQLFLFVIRSRSHKE